MTEPTDAEIDEVTLDVLGYAALDKETNETARMIARAVLQRWGQPSGAGEVDRADAVNLARNCFTLYNHAITKKGVRVLAEAVLSMDAALTAPTAQAAESVPSGPLQDFESPNAQALMRAWEEGWAACRDAEYVGEEAQNDAFNNSNTLNVCIAEDQRLPMPDRAARAPAESVQRDAERLDFVERHPEMSLRHRKGKWAFLGFTNYEYDLHQSLRGAIDAALAAQGGK